jgi:hypothetical protein
MKLFFFVHSSQPLKMIGLPEHILVKPCSNLQGFIFGDNF